MQVALEKVAFAHDRRSGIKALLETALKALDEDGEMIAAIHTHSALEALRNSQAKLSGGQVLSSVDGPCAARGKLS